MSASFLEPEGDDMATLAEALAFIDACEGSASPNGNGSTSGSDSGGATPNYPQSGDKTQISNPKRKRASKNPAGYSTRLLHRKKAEMQQLREQALELEAQVDHLRHARVVGVGALAAHAGELKDRAQSKWLQVAMLEFQRRKRAEITNRRLKELLKSHKTIDEALKGIILKPFVMEGMQVVLEKPPSMKDPLVAVDNSDIIMAQLEKKVSEMYIASNLVFEPESGELPISCEMKRRFDNQLGNVVEIVTKAPLSCSIEAASDALWKELTTLRTYPDKSYRYMQASKPNSMEKNFDQIIRGKGGATPVNGLLFMRKFEEVDRIVVPRAYTMLLPTNGLQLRALVWTIFSRSETDPANASEVRFFVQLYMEVQSGFTARPEDIAYLRDVAFETWSFKMRGHSQYMQELLIEAASGVPSPTLSRSVC